ncbi:MAG TPA: thermonuclease family protein [Nocardioidaceae bacterium]|nr:thermonuclease family protein [Nocardioidaceae bacterium]
MSSAVPTPPRKPRPPSRPDVGRGAVSTRLLGAVVAATLILVAASTLDGGSGEQAAARDDGATAVDSSAANDPGRPVGRRAPAPPPAPAASSRAPDASRPRATSRPRASTRPGASAAASPSAPRVRRFVVARVVDGDTVELVGGQDVRIVGVDTPERGDCGYDEATAAMERLVLGRRVRLTVSDEDRDRYGRLLRYVDVGAVDAGLRQIQAGLAVARYDSRDGYGRHPREARYVATDRRVPDRTCRRPRSLVGQPRTSRPTQGCAAGYSPCLPVAPDLDCADVRGAVRVTGDDEYGLDRDGDGLGCDS